MVLVDTTIWVDHLRNGNEQLAGLLTAGQVLVHVFVVGELALGRMPGRDMILDGLLSMPRASMATDAEVLDFIERFDLIGSGIGYVDAHLLASTRLSSGRLWTRDRRLADAAERLGLLSD